MTEEGKFEVLDLDGWIIQKKFIQVGSSNYTEEALNYVKKLIDDERAILFDRDTHRIYTLGDYYGGDTLKQDLLYYTKILNIDLDEKTIDEISASTPESTLAIQAKNSIEIKTRKVDGKDIIEIGNDLTKMVNLHTISRRDGTSYRLFINQDGKLDIEEYIKPIIKVSPTSLEYDEANNDIYEKTLDIIIDSTIPVENWTELNIEGEDCEILDFNQNSIKINFYKGQDAVIHLTYNDGENNETLDIPIIWGKFAYYGIFDGDLDYQEKGKWELGDIENKFIVDQGMWDYAYLMIPEGYDIIILDDLSSLQGSWYKRKRQIIKNNEVYDVFLTTNLGMGKVRWKIIKNI